MTHKPGGDVYNHLNQDLAQKYIFVYSSWRQTKVEFEDPKVTSQIVSILIKKLTEEMYLYWLYLDEKTFCCITT